MLQRTGSWGGKNWKSWQQLTSPELQRVTELAQWSAGGENPAALPIIDSWLFVFESLSLSFPLSFSPSPSLPPDRPPARPPARPPPGPPGTAFILLQPRFESQLWTQWRVAGYITWRPHSSRPLPLPLSTLAFNHEYIFHHTRFLLLLGVRLGLSPSVNLRCTSSSF